MAKSSPTPDPSADPNGEQICLVAAGTRLEGKFSSEKQIRFDGHLQGDLRCAGRLVLGSGALIVGTIEAREAVIMGRVEGQLRAPAGIKLLAGAEVRGKVSTANLMVEEGALLEGESRPAE